MIMIVDELVRTCISEISLCKRVWNEISVTNQLTPEVSSQEILVVAKPLINEQVGWLPIIKNCREQVIQTKLRSQVGLIQNPELKILSLLPTSFKNPP